MTATNQPAKASTDRLVDQARKTTQDFQEMGGIARDVAQEKLRDLQDTASDYYEQGREKVQHMEQSFEELIREHPVKAVLIATGIGLLLGRFWMRR